MKRQQSKNTLAFLSMFTLTELLIVISIIIMLAGLLLPALTRARGKAYEVACKNNLRQIGFVFSQYNQDYSEFFPSYYSGGATWHKNLIDQGLLSLNILNCPTKRKYSQSNTANYMHYGYNVYHIGSSWRYTGDMNVPAKLSQIKKPAATIIVTETYCTADTKYGYYMIFDSYGGQNGVDVRHLGNVNILWGDLHVGAESIRLSSVPPYSALDNPYMHVPFTNGTSVGNENNYFDRN